MRSSVEAKAFSDALDRVSKVIRKSRLPILEQAIIRFSGNRCLLTATDLSTWITTEIPAQGDTFTVVFQRTKDIAKICHLFEGEISFACAETASNQKDDIQVTLVCGQRECVFESYPAEDFPLMPLPEGDALFSANAAELLERVERTIYAAKDEGISEPPSRTCVHFREHDLFASDGTRAACDTDPEQAFPKPFMAPAKVLRHLKIFGTSQVDFRFWKSYCQIFNGQTSLVFRIPGEQTFDLRKAIPTAAGDVLQVHPKEFLSELKYLKEVSSHEKKPYAYFFNGRLTAPNIDGPHSTSIEVRGYSDTLFGFNISNMLETLKQFSQEEWVMLKIGSPLTPFLVEAEGRSDLR